MVFHVLSSVAGAERVKSNETTYCVETWWPSKGIFHKEDPLKHSYSTFIMQFVVMTSAYVMLRLLLKPLRQPKFVCSVLAGIVASPQVMRHTKIFGEKTFPDEEMLLVRTVGTLGAMYILFLTAVKTDITVIRILMKKALFIGLTSINMSIAVILLLVVIFNLPGIHKGIFSFLFAMGVSLTRLPNVVYAFDELNIMTSDLGQLATSIAMLGEALVWVIIFIRIFIKNASLIWALLAAFALALVIFGAIGRVLRLIITKMPQGKPVHELYIHSILVGALVIGCLTDLLGSVQLGLILFGLVIPSGPPLGSTLNEKIELVATELLMPMFYVGVGYTIEITSISTNNSRKLILLTIMGALAKLFGAILAAFCCKIRFRHCVLLGLMLNVRGPFDLFVFNRWSTRKDVDTETYTVLVLLEVAITAVVTPLIDIFYNPHSRLSASSRRCVRSVQTILRDVELRILCCIHSQDDVPGIISLLEASNPTIHSPLYAVVVHLNELIGQTAPVMAPYKKPMKRVESRGSRHIMRAFENYSINSNNLIGVAPYTVVAAYKGMHEFICRIANDKSTHLIIIPLQGSHEMENASEIIALRNLRENIRDYAPCTVGTFIDKGMHHSMTKGRAISSCKVGVVFIGGPHDREALALAIRMVGQPNVSVTVSRIIFDEVDKDTHEFMEKVMDDALINEFRAKKVDSGGGVYHEVVVKDTEQVITQIGYLKDKFDLILVGQKRRVRGLFSEETFLNWSEIPELGVIGDLVASDFCGEMTSVLVMKHHGDPQGSYHSSTCEKASSVFLKEQTFT